MFLCGCDYEGVTAFGREEGGVGVSAGGGPTAERSVSSSPMITLLPITPMNCVCLASNVISEHESSMNE